MCVLDMGVWPNKFVQVKEVILKRFYVSSQPPIIALKLNTDTVKRKIKCSCQVRSNYELQNLVKRAILTNVGEELFF